MWYNVRNTVAQVAALTSWTELGAPAEYPSPYPEPKMNDTLEITTLGGLSIRVGGEPVTGFYSRKVEALLVYLACTDRPQPRDVLADLLWDEVTQSRAMGNLRVVLHSLREKLGPYVDITRTTVALNPGNDPSTSSGQGVWFDVAELEDGLAPAAEPGGLASPAAADQFADALSLYQGDFLAGFYVRDCPRFEEWQRVEQERLRNLAVAALNALVAFHREQGAYDSALLHARHLLELDPLLEQAHRQVMLCLAYNGQRGAALAQYETCRRILEQELGVEPEPETTALYERVRLGEIAARPEPSVAAPHNLPAQPLPFVGREVELADLGRLLCDPDVRLVTVLGPGGMGKTRIALEAAADQLQAFEDGVFFVALAPLRSVEGIVPAIADAVGFTFYEGGEPRAQLLDYLRSKQMLLVLDNYEHLLSPSQVGSTEEGAALVSQILRAAPKVTALITSRVRLNLQEEQLFHLAGMEFPDWETPEDAVTYSGVALFVQGARRVRRDFEPQGDDLTYLTRICRQVGGMPLGILLAAGWVDTLTPAEIAAEIGQSLDFLETELRNVPERQRSMRAAFDHSWKLLTERQREVMRALSVFRGGFAWEAAQAIIGASLRELRALVNKSLLQFVPHSKAQTGQFVPHSKAQTGQFVPRSTAQTEQRTSEGRYEMHELLRQYAEEKLDKSPDAAAARDRHCAYYCTALERWGEDLEGARQQAALAEMSLDHANIRAAWEWAVKGIQVERLDDMTRGLVWYFHTRGLYQEGEESLRSAAERLTQVATVEGRRVLAGTLSWRALLQAFSGRHDEAPQLARQVLDLLDEPTLADVDTRAERALALCVMRLSSPDPSDERTWKGPVEQSLALFRELGDSYMTANLLAWMGVGAELLGDYTEARQRREESLELRRALGDGMGIAASLISLGFIALMQGQLEEGDRLIRDGSGVYRQFGTRRALAIERHNLALAQYYLGSFAEARALVLETVAIFDELGLRFLQHNFEARILLGYVDLSVGRSEAAHAQGQLILTSAREINSPWYAVGQVLLGAEALAGARFWEARQRLHESIAAHTEVPFWPMLGCPGMGQELALLGFAARGLGDGGQARRRVREALSKAVEHHLFLPIITALSAAALLLIDAGDAERGVEVYALVSRYPHVANSKWFEDVAGKEIAAVAESLPPEVVAAAQERGRARDLWEMAEELLSGMNLGQIG
jgi:predicted ATPase/DNA-binding SARP family transcriptional activator